MREGATGEGLKKKLEGPVQATVLSQHIVHLSQSSHFVRFSRVKSEQLAG